MLDLILCHSWLFLSSLNTRTRETVLGKAPSTSVCHSSITSCLLFYSWCSVMTLASLSSRGAFHLLRPSLEVWAVFLQPWVLFVFSLLCWSSSTRCLFSPGVQGTGGGARTTSTPLILPVTRAQVTLPEEIWNTSRASSGLWGQRWRTQQCKMYCSALCCQHNNSFMWIIKPLHSNN